LRRDRILWLAWNPARNSRCAPRSSAWPPGGSQLSPGSHPSVPLPASPATHAAAHCLPHRLGTGFRLAPSATSFSLASGESPACAFDCILLRLPLTQSTTCAVDHVLWPCLLLVFRLAPSVELLAIRSGLTLSTCVEHPACCVPAISISSHLGVPIQRLYCWPNLPTFVGLCVHQRCQRFNFRSTAIHMGTARGYSSRPCPYRTKAANVARRESQCTAFSARSDSMTLGFRTEFQVSYASP